MVCTGACGALPQRRKSRAEPQSSAQKCQRPLSISPAAIRPVSEGGDAVSNPHTEDAHMKKLNAVVASVAVNLALFVTFYFALTQLASTAAV
jgi:hypothetical protein